MIYFSKYGDDKFDILREHKFTILKEQVVDCVKNPKEVNKIKRNTYVATSLVISSALA